MVFSPDITVEQLKNIGITFVNMESSKQWWLGDWWVALEKNGKGKSICAEVGLMYQSTADCGFVARQIESSRRRERLSFSHHREVCGINIKDKEREKLVQDNFLKLAEQEGWGVFDLRAQVQSFLDEEKWTVEEKERREIVENGGTIVISLNTDLNLLRWAEVNDYLMKIDRTTDWGNPFILNADGDRDTVCDNYSIYLDMKPSLLKRLDELKGKVLGCWCYPERCHGAELLGRLDNDM